MLYVEERGIEGGPVLALLNANAGGKSNGKTKTDFPRKTKETRTSCTLMQVNCDLR